jgi:hypothetical protein
MEDHPGDYNNPIRNVSSYILPFGNDRMPFETFDVRGGLADVGELPSDKQVMKQRASFDLDDEDDDEVVDNFVLARCENRLRDLRRIHVTIANERRRC